MRRFWLLLLAFVMPLQMSWAAVHLCDETPVSASAYAHAAEEPQTESKAKAVAADACCVGAHGCHGLHSLMSQSDQCGVFPASAGAFLESDHMMAARNFSVRHERPQWTAA